ncbi:hypothetical protein FGIG_02893 [Fasciola gigantica]|uniref:Uncharacterized protein n=1 Tax=Fasciola gigantica TaxID=46835 RepID=A0A504YNF5_FASGI|nr:hypothetical protein FGIG_02893 [Fasciola gigantica]
MFIRWMKKTLASTTGKCEDTDENIPCDSNQNTTPWNVLSYWSSRCT